MEHASMDAVYAALGHLSREWGEHGYSVRVTSAGSRSCVLHVVHADGSRFVIVADRFGNVLGHGADVATVLAAVAS